MCVFVCVFIKLHIAVLSGPAVLVILSYSYLVPPKWGINDVCVLMVLGTTVQSGPVMVTIIILHWSSKWSVNGFVTNIPNKTVCVCVY